MLGVGFQELLLILVVAVVVVGPKKLPDLAKSLGKGLQEFRKATDGLKSSLNENETFKDLQGLKSTMQDTVSSLKPSGLLDIDVNLNPTPAATPAPELKKFEAPVAEAEVVAAAPPLEPKKPVENLEGRIVLMDGIVSEHHQPLTETMPAAPDTEAILAAASLPVAAPAPAKQDATAGQPEPPTKPAEAPKKTDA
ncbi:MAG: Sec-independent protein translocase protein TatB [Pseudomonadota bacterium]